MPDLLGLYKSKIIQMASSQKQVNSNAAIIRLMVDSAGVIVANIYYNEPILKEPGLSINANEAEAGMFFLLPLRDKLNCKAKPGL